METRGFRKTIVRNGNKLSMMSMTVYPVATGREKEVFSNYVINLKLRLE